MNRKKWNNILVLLMVAFAAWAQPKINSPYSRFGLGDLYDQNLLAPMSLGNLSATYHDPYHVNILNPASLGFQQTTAFETGAHAKRTTLIENDFKRPVWNGNLNYLSLAFPMFNAINDIIDRRERKFFWGMNVVLLPYTYVGYDISDLAIFPPTDTLERTYTGTGGTYRLMWSNGLRYKQFSAGITTGHTFGKLSYTRNIDFQESEPQSFDNNFTDEESIRNFFWRGGVMYTINLEKPGEDKRSVNKTLTLGLTASSKSSMRIKAETNYLRIFTGGAGEFDTVAYQSEVRKEGTLPGEIQFGLGFMDGLKWKAGINYTLQKWSQYANGTRSETLDDIWILAFGASYRPDITAYEGFWPRIDYRLGFQTGKDPRVFGGKQLSFWSLHGGLGFPFFSQRKISFINLGLEVGSWGDRTLLKNNYFKISAGFTLNDDEWFLKRKFN